MSSLAQVTQPSVAVSRDRSRAIFGQTMGLVALTCAVAALGAYLGRDISRGWGIVAFIGAIACIVGLNVAIQRSEHLAIGLLFGLGAFMGLAAAPMLAYYASVNPQALWQAGGTTALFIGGFGAYGYATRHVAAEIGAEGCNGAGEGDEAHRLAEDRAGAVAGNRDRRLGDLLEAAHVRIVLGTPEVRWRGAWRAVRARR